MQNNEERIYEKYKQDPLIMPKEDLLAILSCVSSLKTTLPILEIGTFEGQTTAAMAEYCVMSGMQNHIYTIDGFDLFWNGRLDPEPKARETLSSFENVTIIKGLSNNEETLETIEALLPYGASMVFIDGGHTAEIVESDIINYGKIAKEMVVLHDINYVGVKNGLMKFGINDIHNHSGIDILSSHGGNTGIARIFANEISKMLKE